MAEMKDSGVAWINTIPKEWEIKKIKVTIQNHPYSKMKLG